ncbi:MAG TPA: heme-binding beta-barrel domain-containing protein [bacterium]
MNEQIIENLGPLRPLVGIWEGVMGDDTAPSDNRGVEKNKYRERVTFNPIGPVKNHEQTLYGFRYYAQNWRIGEPDQFHEEVGYWLWDAKEKQLIKCIVIPRGVTIIAGGRVEPDAKRFKLTAELGSKTYGICSNPFLDQEFPTVGFELEMILHDDKSFSYDANTKIQIKGQKNIFEHRDKNTLKLVKP